MKYSGVTFIQLYSSVELEDWLDEARNKKTFYSQNKKTIREMFEHVKRSQYYYLSRTGFLSPKTRRKAVAGILQQANLGLIGSNDNPFGLEPESP